MPDCMEVIVVVFLTRHGEMSFETASCKWNLQAKLRPNTVPTRKNVLTMQQCEQGIVIMCGCECVNESDNWAVHFPNGVEMSKKNSNNQGPNSHTNK